MYIILIALALNIVNVYIKENNNIIAVIVIV